MGVELAAIVAGMMLAVEARGGVRVARAAPVLLLLLLGRAHPGAAFQRRTPLLPLPPALFLVFFFDASVHEWSLPV